jgi:hypothetical protein
MATALLITRQDLVRYSVLDGNVDTDKFIGFVKKAQDIHIQAMLGTRLLEKIQADIIAGTLAEPYISKEELDFLMEQYRQTAMNYKERFIDYVINNSSSFPEYYQNTSPDVFPDQNTNMTGWVI